MLNVSKIRSDFPILKRKINNQPIVYLDNGATSQKPIQVINAMDNYYKNFNANINRGTYDLSMESTKIYEDAREKVAKFLNASSPEEIIFTRNSTEAINLVAYTYGKANIHKDDEMAATEMEHHSNLVPWQILARESGATLKFIPFNKEGLLETDKLEDYISKKTKLLTFVHVSNTLGTINDVKLLIKRARQINPEMKILIDGSQSVPHMKIDLQSLDCDFYAFTGHKMLGPMGIGVLFGKKDLLNEMPPFLYGGDMIKEVYLDHSTWNKLPEKFEAGTPNVAGAVGLAAAIDYLEKLGMNNIREQEKDLTDYALIKMSTIPGLTIYGPKDTKMRGGIISFTLHGIHAHDTAEVFNKSGICVRAGHHCTMPLHKKLGVSATVRASFYIYNTKLEIDKMINAIRETNKIFKI